MRRKRERRHGVDPGDHRRNAGRRAGQVRIRGRTAPRADRPTGTCSTTKTDFVLSLGAENVIDYTRDDFAGGARRYDLILDIAGNPALARLRRALTPTGTAVITGGEQGGRWTASIGNCEPWPWRRSSASD